MPNQNNNNQSPNFNIDDLLKNFVGVYSALMEEANRRLTEDNDAAQSELATNYENARAQVHRRLAEKQKREDENILESLAKYQIMLEKGLKGDIQAYSQKLEQDRVNEKLKNEINILQETSKETLKKQKQEQAQYIREKAKLEGRKLTKEEKEAVREGEKDTFKDQALAGFKYLKEALDEGNQINKVAGENTAKALKKVGQNITAGLNQINTAIQNYAKLQTSINTRLQGLPNYKENSAFSTIANTLGSIAYSPLLDAQSLYQNVDTLVSEGIGQNIEQRALLMTVKDAIATTFDVNSASLKRLIRLQQEDSTAARLGMESYLTKWLNSYVQNTEYLTQTFDNVADSLFEASAALGSRYGAGASTEFEYVVQKWLSALTGVGLSDETGKSIAQALGELGSGNISNLGSSGIQNLLVMAASKAGQTYAELLTKGLDAVDANKLLYYMTDYLKELASTSDNNNIVRNALANTFGVTVSDLVSVSNLQTDELTNIYNNMMSYSNMYNQLRNEFNSITTRMGIANILENAFSNLTYQTGMSIAANPVGYALWKITDLIQSVTGGINIPYVSAFGSGIDLEATVENLMKIGIVGVGMLANIGGIVNAVGSIFKGETLLNAVGISENKNRLDRGTGLSEYTLQTSGIKKRTSGTTVSQTTYVGNVDSDTYYESTLTAASDKEQTKLQQQKEDTKDPVVEYLIELEFANDFKSLVSNVEHMVSEGILIQGIKNKGFESSVETIKSDVNTMNTNGVWVKGFKEKGDFDNDEKEYRFTSFFTNNLQQPNLNGEE